MSGLLVAIGLATLVMGSEMLIRGGSSLANRFGIPPIVIGLTVVSIGTSMPELAIGIDAALRGAGPLAVGNIAGTNIVNLLLILGLSAAMLPLAIDSRTIRFELPLVAVVSVLVVLMTRDGQLSRFDAIVLVIVAVAYTIAVVLLAIRHPRGADDSHGREEPSGSTLLDLILLAAGLVVIAMGADWLVEGAVDMAVAIGVSEVTIGLTIVAIGSSAPELVTTVVSTVRGERDIAVGNLIGSSIYNVALILGVTALVEPLQVTSELIRVDLPLMAAVAILIVPIFVTGRRVSRAEGITMVLGYVVYLGIIVTMRT